MVEVDDPDLYRRTLIASLSDDELSPAALAARIVLVDVVRSLASRGIWPGATLQSTD
jgi:LysR family tcuABC transcriptional regulator